MFVGEKIIFLQMQKTASTHIAKVLADNLAGSDGPKHGQLLRDPGGAMVVGSIRNPWDWYVSLWAYGCKGEGAVRKHLTDTAWERNFRIARQNLGIPAQWGGAASALLSRRSQHSGDWKRIYGCVDDPGLFREWLRLILSDEGKQLLPEEYPFLGLRHFAGFMTFRFATLFIRHGDWKSNASRVASYDELCRLYEHSGIASRYIRMERLEEDLRQLLVDVGVTNPRLPTAKTNSSSHNSTAFYYDDETIELVRRNEKFLIDLFGYLPPTTEETVNAPLAVTAHNQVRGIEAATY